MQPLWLVSAQCTQFLFPHRYYGGSSRRSSKYVGLLVAESRLVPTVALSSENTAIFLRHALGLAEVDSSSKSWIFFNPRCWCKAFHRALQVRLGSLDLTSVFIALNRVRDYHFRLARLRQPIEIWRRGTVFLAFDRETLGWSHSLPNLVRVPDPLLPYCITCSHNPITTKSAMPTVVVSVHYFNDEKGRSGSKKLMEGLELARASIVTFLDKEDCAWNGMCWKGPSDFQVVRPGGEIPEVLPPESVSFEKTTFLDTLARHKPVAIVSLCDDMNSWTKSLGPPVLCLETSWSPSEIAFRLLRLWHSHGDHSDSEQDTVKHANSVVTNEQDGLGFTVSLLEQIGLLRDRHHNGKEKWLDSSEMGRDVLIFLDSVRIDGLFGKKNNTRSLSSGAPFVLLAWLFLALAALYIPLRNTTGLHRMRLRHLHHRSYQQLSLEAVIDEFWFRLPDLEKVWNETPTLSLEAPNNETTDHHGTRKRRATKKRH